MACWYMMRDVHTATRLWLRVAGCLPHHFLTTVWMDAMRWKMHSLCIRRPEQTAKSNTNVFPKDICVHSTAINVPLSLFISLFLLSLLFLKSIILECILYEKLHCAQRNRSLTHKSFCMVTNQLFCTYLGIHQSYLGWRNLIKVFCIIPTAEASRGILC